jgi:hypothetical protein
MSFVVAVPELVASAASDQIVGATCRSYVPALESPAIDRCGGRTAMMPLRTTTRERNRANGIAAQRRHNRQAG